MAATTSESRSSPPSTSGRSVDDEAEPGTPAATGIVVVSDARGSSGGRGSQSVAIGATATFFLTGAVCFAFFAFFATGGGV
jgi:hypothetical protein